jgi:hypothetical protein
MTEGIGEKDHSLGYDWNQCPCAHERCFRENEGGYGEIKRKSTEKAKRRG